MSQSPLKVARYNGSNHARTFGYSTVLMVCGASFGVVCGAPYGVVKTSSGVIRRRFASRSLHACLSETSCEGSPNTLSILQQLTT
jgi:hypothetical protein